MTQKAIKDEKDKNAEKYVKIKMEILKQIKTIEKEKNIRVLMAVEAGSRAWGFSSSISDYDIRFVYIRNKNWYLSINTETKKDVFNFTVTNNIDMSGWDIRKALRLFWNSNPAFIEWLQSPIVYVDSGDFKKECVKLLPDMCLIDKQMHHYRSIVKSHFHRYVENKEDVLLKKYLYILRSIFTVQWFEKHGTIAPIRFDELLKLLKHGELLDIIEGLVAKKKNSKMKIVIPVIPKLNRFIESEINRMDTIKIFKSYKKITIEQVNELFRSVLDEQ